MSAVDFSPFVRDDHGRRSLYLQVDGMRCASCAWKIEQGLQSYDGVEARVNFSTQRLRVSWPRTLAAGAANDFAHEVEALGFHVAPFDHDSRLLKAREEQRFLLACLAVAGFAAGNIMLFSQALWFSPAGSLEGATRDLMHWIMALIALPATLYCGRPFFRSAWQALSHGRTNMDVPISLAVILANALSLFETIRHGHYVYFDASVMLLFFLLIGRFLDAKARGRARETAEGLLAMLEGSAQVRDGGGVASVRIRDLKPGQILMVAAGEKIAADGVVRLGSSDIDTRLVTGETLPCAAGPGDKLYAGTINQSAPLEIEISAPADESLLSEIVGLMETAEQSQSPYVRFADHVARLYAPVVHILALTTFLGWLLYGHRTGAVTWEDALLKAMAVLIITCPCALGLAVPVVHVLASSRLFAQGILLKSGHALEALSRIDTVVFDKTGTLTRGNPKWLNREALSGDNLRLAIAMAMHSRHPLSRAVAETPVAGALPPMTVEDVPGCGLRGTFGDEPVWLGKGAWVGVPAGGGDRMELWFRRGDGPAVRLVFADIEREDAADTVAALQARGLTIVMLSGDRRPVAEAVGRRLGIDQVLPELTPAEKVARLEAMAAQGGKVLMVGDGLNDAAALATALVSMSPSSGVDITQNVADLVYRGDGLSPVLTAYDTACGTQGLVKQNFALSLAYNLIAIPVAVAGLVTPVIAALAMSGSSLIVVLNSLRLGKGGGRASNLTDF